MYYQLIDNIRNKSWFFIIIGVLLALLANFLGAVDRSYLILFIGFLIGLLLLVVVIYNPVYAIVINWSSSFVLGFIVYIVLQITSVPLGIIFEIVNFLGLVVLLLRQELKGLNTLTGKLFLLWLLVCCIELINPLASSRVAWFFAIRQLLFIIVPFFVIYSVLLTNKNSLRILFTTWISFSVLAAIYTIYQEFFGIPSWNFEPFARNEKLMSLIVTFGRIRKMSFFDGPMTNGMTLAFNAVICMGMAFQKNFRRGNQVSLLVAGLLSAWAMTYTGTRTASVLFVFGMAIYILLNRNKGLIAGSSIVGVLLMAYISVTGGGAALHVMTTAFNPDDDPSMIVRYNNQVMLRSYIFRSPIGFGMGSTGSLGSRFSPYTFLGSFPPDSELVRIVIETGLLGLGIYLFMMFSFLRKALDTLSNNTGDSYKNLKMISVAVLFMFLLGQYPQELLNVLPLKVLFAFFLAFISLKEEEMKKLEF